MKAVVDAFNQEEAQVGAFSVITNLRMELFQALLLTHKCLVCLQSWAVAGWIHDPLTDTNVHLYSRSSVFWEASRQADGEFATQCVGASVKYKAHLEFQDLIDCDFCRNLEIRAGIPASVGACHPGPGVNIQNTLVLHTVNSE